jgi:LuxR family maltose regulon positive regulatory protein
MSTPPRVWTETAPPCAYLETAQEGTPIRLDTPAWLAWLDAATTTSFAYPIYDAACGYIEGVMTVRKERRQRGGCYWTAYRRRHGRLTKIYLGASATLTHQRLEEVARAFVQEPPPSSPPPRRLSPGTPVAASKTEEATSTPAAAPLDVTTTQPRSMLVGVPSDTSGGAS